MDVMETYEAYYRIYLPVYLPRYPSVDMARAMADRLAREEVAGMEKRLSVARGMLPVDSGRAVDSGGGIEKTSEQSSGDGIPKQSLGTRRKGQKGRVVP